MNHGLNHGDGSGDLNTPGNLNHRNRPRDLNRDFDLNKEEVEFLLEDPRGTLAEIAGSLKEMRASL